MGPLCRKKRVQNSVQRDASIVPRPSLLPAASKSAAGRRSRQSPLKRGSGRDNTGMSRILLSNFPRSQEERETPVDHRPLCSQSFCRLSELQNGDAEKSEKCHSSQRLGIFVGPDGRLFACSDSSFVTQIPQVHVERPSIPVQSARFRSLDQPSRVYSPDGRHCDVSKGKGNNSPSLPRRLVNSKPKSSSSVGTQTISIVPDHFSGSDYQLREIRPSTSSGVHLHRDGVLDSDQYCQGTSRQSSENIGNSQTVLTEILGISQRFPVSLGTTGSSSRLCNAGTVTSPAITNVSAQPVETSQIPVKSSDRCNDGNFTSPQMVATGRSISSGGSSEDRPSLPFHIHGCQPLRLGGSCGARGTSVSWSMDRKSISAPHQHIRDESNFSISNTSPSHCEEYHCNGVNRQHYSGSLFKASGRDPFPRPLSGSLGHSEHVLKTQHPVVNKAHSWPVQHPGRPNEQNGQTDHHRVVTRSRNSQQSIHDHGLSVHRPVCHKAKQQVASVCVTHTGPTGVINRCSLDGLESHSRLCVSSVPSNSSCDKQSSIISVQNRIDSASMARQTVVSRTTASVGVTPGISARNSQTADSAKRKDHTPKPGSTATSRLGIVQQSLRNRQFSREVADHVSKARRESTVKVYDAKWQVFCRWAHRRKTNPIQATPQIVADFLTFLFNVKKIQVSTIKGYRSTISNTLKFQDTGYDFGSHPVLSELIKSFQRQRPVDRTLAPKWDLAFVLSHMCKAPFEPLDKASMFFLSVKTAFLLTMATARRISEVHAFSIDADHFRFSKIDGSLILRTQAGFLAKNQLPSRAPDSIKIPKLSNFCGNDNFNRMLCPIRAVKIYLNRTKLVRKNRTRLFIPVIGDKDINKCSISRWVKFAIKNAYSSIASNSSKLLKPRAHELRALSSSWAYLNCIPLEEVLQAAVWSNSSLFAVHYLRDFGDQTANLRALGPVIAAQKEVGGARKSSSTSFQC